MNFIIGITFFAAFLYLKKILNKIVQKQALQKGAPNTRRKFISVCISSLLFIVLSMIMLNVIDIGYGDIAIFISSFFAVLGVALIAQWSMLSNITASVLIFFVFPYRIGDKIKIENDEMTGVITDIGMFHVSIKRDDGNVILYPNNLLLQKAVTKLIVAPKKVKKITSIKINRRPLTRIDKD